MLGLRHMALRRAFTRHRLVRSFGEREGGQVGKAGHPTVGREFVCLDAMRTARAAFFDDIVSHAQRHQAELAASGKNYGAVAVAMLRSDNAYQIAEFYYMAEEFQLSDPRKIACYVDRHNQDMHDLIRAPERLALHGVRKERISEAIFSNEEKAKVVENAACGRLRLDQSDVGRFLAPLISPETCRKTLVALSEGGLLERRNIGAVIVTSTGALEAYYRQHLQQMAEMIGAVIG